MALPRSRERLADALGLLAILLVLLDYFRPALLFLPTVTAGGDTPCHYPTFVWFKEHLLSQGRLHGWYPGAYLGHPLLLYYFPLPFLIMSALTPFFGMPVAFKLGTALPVFLLPLLTYAAFRLMGFRFPGPLVGAGAAAVFLFHEDNPIWGGTIASTLTGEFSYTYGIGLAVLFLGLCYRAYTRGHGPLGAALLLGLVAFAHGYAVLWAGLATTYFLFGSRRPWRTVGFLAVVAGMAFATAGVLLVPLLSDWGYTTPYSDPWITVTTHGLVPPFLWPLFALAALGLLGTILFARRGGPDHRLLFLAYASLVGIALAAAGPALGVIDVRFVPFAQLAACLLGGATLGLLLEKVKAPDLAALGFVLLGLLYGDARSQVVRHWIDWNYTGLEAKELWPAFREMTEGLRGGVGDPRVAVEYSSVHERAGSIRMYETLPHFTGRSTLEGVYNQASLSTHAVYYLASELGAASPNPFKEIEYSRFDTPAALDHLRLFNVSDVVALSPQLVGALEGRSDVTLTARIPPYSVFRLRGGSGRYVEPVRFAPVRSAPAGWRDKALRWFTRQPLSEVPLVFTDDARVGGAAEPDPWLAPPAVALPPGVEVAETIEPERIAITTNRPGHPLLVKVAWHPRWRAEGALGPYLVAPALMLIVPQQEKVSLVYARTRGDRAGLGLSLGALVGAGLWYRRKPRTNEPRPVPVRVDVSCDDSGLPRPPRRWGGVLPASLLALLVAARLFHGERDRSAEAQDLYERASRAFADERFLDAAEYARHGAARGVAPLRDELLCLRGESLLRAGQAAFAALSFETLIRESPDSPYTAQALFSGAAAREAAGDQEGARADRRRLVDQFSETPWAKRLAAGPKR